MSYFLLIKKSIHLESQYILGKVVQNMFLIIQALVATYVGLYFNNLTHLKTPEQLFLYYAIGLALINPIQRGNFVRNVEEEVEKGDIAIHFTKPYNYFLHVIFKDLSTKLSGILFTAAIIIGMLGLINGFFAPTFEQILRIIIIWPITIIFIYATNAIFAQLALFLESATWLVAIFGVASFFIGGGLLPMGFLPNFAQYILPTFFFGAPLEFILSGIYPNFWLFIIYSILLILINYFLFQYIKKRMQLNGG